MEYGKIINRSFEIAWRHKTLWLLGLFAGGTASSKIDGSWFSDDLEIPTIDWGGGASIPTFDFDPSTILIFAAFLLLFIIVMMILHFISVAGLVDAANNIVRGSGNNRLFDSISVGASKLLQFIGLGVLLLVGILVGMFALIMIIVGASVLGDIFGGLAILFCLPLILIIVFVVATIGLLAQRAIVVRDVSIGDGLEEAYYLFKNNLGKCVAIFALYVALAIGIAILSFMVFGIPALFYGLLAQSWLVALLTFVIEIPIMLVASGFVGTAMANIYTLFYFELLEPGILSKGDQIYAESNPGILP